MKPTRKMRGILNNVITWLVLSRARNNALLHFSARAFPQIDAGSDDM